MFREDADIAQIARDVLQGEGIRVVCEAELLHVARGTTAAVSATFKHGETGRNRRSLAPLICHRARAQFRHAQLERSRHPNR
jgi:hypothetical protein